MSTSQGTGNPAERPAAQAQAAPATELSPRAAGDGEAQEAAPLTGSIAAAPGDTRQLQAEIERTREQLGETVQELVTRADMKGRARAKAAELRGTVRSTTAQVRRNAAARAGNARGRATAVGAPVWQATPDPVRQAVTKGAGRARERWMPLALAAGVLILGYLALRQCRRPSPDGGAAPQP